VYSAIECAPGENGVVVVALAVVVVELAIVEVELAGAVVVVVAAIVVVEAATEVVVLAAEVVVELATEVVVVGMIDVVVVVFFAAHVATGDINQTSNRMTRQVFFMRLSPLLIEINGADARGNVARGIPG
jgi:hypothetical protein